MEKLYAPWRHAYVTHKEKQKTPLKNDCVFCQSFSEDSDTQNLILKRLNHCVIMMNYYPYNAGHLMVLPLEHKASLEELTPEIRFEMMEATSASAALLSKIMRCNGMNIGVNLGQAGGGGIPGHLHIHILPRWQGDTNFLATLGETTLICSDFHVIYQQLFPDFSTLKIPALSC
jgi:ATP adenylyltransferase